MYKDTICMGPLISAFFSTVNTTVPHNCWLAKATDKEPLIGKNFNTEEPPIWN